MIRLQRHGQPLGAASGPHRRPLVALPGLDGSIASIAPLVAQLMAHRSIRVVDYSQERSASLDALTEEIAGELERELAIDGPFDLLGHSLGSILTARLAAHAKIGPRVERVVLVATARQWRTDALRWVGQAIEGAPAWLFRQLARAAVATTCGPVGDGWRHPVLAAMGRSDGPGLARRLRWQSEGSFASDLRSISQPLLLVMGERDRWVPNGQQELGALGELFSDHVARILTIPNAGHVLMPSLAIERAARHIHEFLESSIRSDAYPHSEHGRHNDNGRAAGPRPVR